jgi:hypothetical protein
MTLELNEDQISLIRISLDTRLQRIDSMIRLFQQDGTERAQWMEKQYSKERFDAQSLLDMFSVQCQSI